MKRCPHDLNNAPRGNILRMEQLIFVYNADSGRWNAYLDMAHKIFSPKTYPCSLCDLTYGIFKIQPEWDDFVKNAPVPFTFLHKDEFHTQFPEWTSLPLPAVLKASSASATNVLIDRDDLAKLQTIEDLKSLIMSRLERLDA